MQDKQPPSEQPKAPKRDAVYAPRGPLKRALALYEVLAVVLFLALFIIGGIVWRISSGPLDISFAKDYIETALNEEGAAQRTSLAGAMLHWPDLRGPLFLGLKQVDVEAADGRPILQVKELALALSKRKLLIGKIAPKAVVLRSPSLHIARTASGRLDFGFAEITRAPDNQGGYVDLPPEKTASDMEALRLQIIEGLDGLTSNKTAYPLLAQFEVLEIENASLVVEDYMNSASWQFPDFDAVLRAEGNTLALAGGLALGSQFQDDARFLIKAEYNGADASLSAGAAARNLDSSLLGLLLKDSAQTVTPDFKADVEFSLRSGAALSDIELHFALTSEKGEITLPDYYAAALSFEDLNLNVIYSDKDSSLAFKDTSLTLNDLPVTIGGGVNIADKSLVPGTIKITFPMAPQDKIDALWPQNFREENAYEWVVHNLSEGTFTGLGAALGFSITQEEEARQFNFGDAKITFDFQDMKIDYRNPMTPITAGRGKGSFDYGAEILEISLDAGTLGTLAINSADLSITNIMEDGGAKAALDATLSGPVSGGLEYITREPIAVQHKFADILDQVKGNASLTLGLQFPATSSLRVEDIKIDLGGTIENAFLPGVVADMPLTGGPFTLSVNNERAQLKGAGLLDGRPVDLTWMTYLESVGKPYQMRVDARLDADPNLRRKLNIDLSDFLEGSVPLSLVYLEKAGGLAEAQIDMDLNKARVFIEAMGFEKPAGVRGFARATAMLEDENLTELRGLSVSSQDLQIDGGLLKFEGDSVLTRGNIESFTVGRSNGVLDFEINPATKLTKIVIKGAAFDLQPILGAEKDEEPYDAPPLELFITADKMFTSENAHISAGKIYADIDARGSFNQLEFDGRAGQGAVYLRYKPNEQGAQTFHLEADDAGAALRIFGLYEDIRGGKLIVYGEPVGGFFDKNLVGVAEISNFKVVNAPVLARLLGSASQNNLSGLLRNDGIAFSKLESDFDWLYSPSGGVLVLSDGRTSGNALGLTFKGTFDNRDSTIDVSGTIVPLSGINKVVSSIPIVGQILSGGTDSIFAATYTVQGEAKEPDVSVNPLSVLTPGILRRILFEN